MNRVLCVLAAMVLATSLHAQQTVMVSAAKDNTQMVKEAVNATAAALNRATSFADADQSWLTARTDDARGARNRFNKNS